MVLEDDAAPDAAPDTAVLKQYCGRTIVKNTQSVANATTVFDFYRSALSAVCQHDEPCDLSCARCGHARRAALPPPYSVSSNTTGSISTHTGATSISSYVVS